jgi:hypothetical protein
VRVTVPATAVWTLPLASIAQLRAPGPLPAPTIWLSASTVKQSSTGEPPPCWYSTVWCATEPLK